MTINGQVRIVQQLSNIIYNFRKLTCKKKKKLIAFITSVSSLAVTDPTIWHVPIQNQFVTPYILLDNGKDFFVRGSTYCTTLTYTSPKNTEKCAHIVQ
jgi:hypothetical protein